MNALALTCVGQHYSGCNVVLFLTLKRAIRIALFSTSHEYVGDNLLRIHV